MKHFLPSSVMLTPFLVKYYDEDNDSNDELDSQSEDATQTQATTSQPTE